MKPISMKMKGLNSFLEVQEIDFEKLTSQGLFGIFGPTGSGKTSILDGMTLALYGTTSRNSTNYINVNTDKASVEYIFSIQEKQLHKYLVSRSFKRTKDGGIRSDSAKFVDITEEEPAILADRVGTVNAKCQEVLGLSKDDFFRTVVLPQGKFSEFLKLEGMERNKMLERLFHLEKYGERLAFLVKEQAGQWEGKRREQDGALSRYEAVTTEAIQGLEQKKTELEQNLSQKEIALKKMRKKLEDSKEQISLWEEYDAACKKEILLSQEQEEIDFLQENLKKAEIANKLFPYFTDYQESITKAKNSKQKADTLIEMCKVITQRFNSAQESFQKAEEGKQNKLPVWEQKKKNLLDALKLSEEQDKQRQLFDEQKKSCEETKKELWDAQEKMEKLLQGIEVRKAEKTKLQQAIIENTVSSEVQQMIMDGFQKTRDLMQLKNRRTVLEKNLKADEKNIAEKEREKRELLQLLKEKETEKTAYLQKTWEGQKKKCEKLSAEIETAQTNKIELQEKKEAQEQLYVENMAAILATSLEEGMPCPVCGSIHHEKTQTLSQKADILALQKQKETLEKEIQNVHETIAGLKTQLLQEQQVVFENLPIASKLAKELQNLQTEIVKKETEIEALQKNYQERKLEWETENEEIHQRENELKLQKKAVKIEDFQTEYEILQEKNKEREELQKKLEIVEQNLDARIQNREKGERIIQELKAKQTETSLLQKQTEEKILEIREKILERAGTEEKLSELLNEVEISIITLNQQYEHEKTLFDKAATEEKELSQQLAAAKALAEASEKDSVKKYAFLKEKMKNFSVTEETYIEKYYTEEKKFSQIKEKIENFQKETIRIQEQMQQIKKKLVKERVDKSEFILLEKELQTLETETTEENKSFGAVRKELEQMKTAWKEKENVCVLLEKIHHKLDILSELEELFRGKRFVEYISRYYLEHIAREADTGLKEMTGNTYGLEIDENTAFIIRDYKNGGASRPASTLSGGETFMASLALALALSSQIQMKGAAPLELFFLDEGFGTLDENCLEVVMEALEKIRNKKRSVGVITHVEEIKNRIPVHLLIEPAKAGEGGSKISIQEL